MSLVERKLFKCKEISEDDETKLFPPLLNEAIDLVRIQHDDNTYSRQVFACIRVNKNEEKYIDVYFINKLIYYPQCYRRFIILKDYRLRENDEDEFEFLCRQSRIDMEVNDFIMLQNSFMEDFCPEMSLKVYGGNDVGNYLMHIYYATHRSGPREILYKAGCNITAEMFEKIEGCNMLGNSPESILGIPLNLIRIFESHGLIDKMATVSGRNNAFRIYQKYSSFFNGKQGQIPDKYQWKYLEEHEHIGQGCFDKRIYHRLHNANEEIYRQYKRFIELSSELKDIELITTSKIPNQEKIGIVVAEMEIISLLREDMDVIDKKIRRRSNNKNYEYFNDEYIIMNPKCTKDVIDEAIMQDNCLIACGYIEMMANGKTWLVFIRKKKNPQKSYVTIEIKNNRIIQAKGKTNSAPNKAIWKFLKDFCMTYGIKFNSSLLSH